MAAAIGEALAGLLEALPSASGDPNGWRAAADPGPRRPSHVVYGGAHLFRAETAEKLGALARAHLDTYGPDAGALAHGLGHPHDALADAVYARVLHKLRAEPIEDLRVDFEDGYGVRDDATEDADAVRAGAELGVAARDGRLPPFVGVRVKAIGGPGRARAVQTLDLFLASMLDHSGRLPDGFVACWPKVESATEAAVGSAILAAVERHHGLPEGAVAVELMVESPRALVGPQGLLALPALAAAAGPRLRGVHLGSYDLTAACGVVGAHQRADHPLCELARALMLVQFAGSDVQISDGATTLMPIGPHRAPSTDAERAENARVVHAAWQAHAGNVRRALASGIYQGWDLHPAQLVPRWATLYRFYREALPEMTARLRRFVDGAATASRVGAAFDDAATGRGLVAFFARGEACGAISAEERAAAGL